MGKNQTATAEATEATADGTEATATAAQEPKPETLAAKQKRLILALASEIKESGELYDDTVDFLNEVAGELAGGGTRGTPAPLQLEAATDKRNEIYARMTTEDRPDGRTVVVFASPEDEALNETLTTKIANLKRTIAKAKKAKKETDEAPENVVVEAQN